MFVNIIIQFLKNFENKSMDKKCGHVNRFEIASNNGWNPRPLQIARVTAAIMKFLKLNSTSSHSYSPCYRIL